MRIHSQSTDEQIWTRIELARRTKVQIKTDQRKKPFRTNKGQHVEVCILNERPFNHLRLKGKIQTKGNGFTFRNMTIIANHAIKIV